MSTTVCRCQVTNEQLAEWGFPVEERTHCVGAWHLVRKGTTRREALWKAQRVGVSLVCPQNCPHRPERKQWTPPKVNAEALAWFLSVKRPEGGLAA